MIQFDIKSSSFFLECNFLDTNKTLFSDRQERFRKFEYFELFLGIQKHKNDFEQTSFSDWNGQWMWWDFFSFLIAIFFYLFFCKLFAKFGSVGLVRMAKRRARVQIPGDRCVFSWLIWDLYLIIMTFKVWWNSRVAITWTKGKQSIIIIIVFHPKFALPTIFFFA